MMTVPDPAAVAYADASPDDEPVFGFTAADALWAAATSPLDGGWVEGEMSPFALEWWTVDALTYFNEVLDPAYDRAAGESEAQARLELGCLF